jgi:hypothetical protein
MAVTTSSDTSVGLHPWPKDTVHVLFREQPASFEVFGPENLAAWEAQVQEMVGIPAMAAATHDSSALATTSFCGTKPDGHPNPCDCDVLPTTLAPTFSASTESKGSRHAWPEAGLPIIFQRQPTEYEVLPPSRYKEWEDNVLTMANVEMKAEGRAGYLPTISWCGHGKTPPACDSDTIPG